MASQYSTIQKLSLAGTVIGALLCLVGACAPYWLVSDLHGLSGLADLVGKFAKVYMGLFIYCGETLGETTCEMFDMDNDSGWFHLTRITASGCVLLGGLSGLISLCLACCTCCKRIIPVGILAFLAAVSGAASAIIFNKNMNVFTSSFMDIKLASYGWAFYMFCAGVGILGVVSFMACFSAPENPIRGMVLSQPSSIVLGMSQQQTTTTPYCHLQEQGPAATANTMVDPGVTTITPNGY